MKTLKNRSFYYMNRTYKCLSQREFQSGKYKLIPLRDEDKLHIMQWRNDQIDVLRQDEPLTIEHQLNYFKNVVSKLFDQIMPNQLLFSFMEDEKVIGYGGLVHIDWKSRNAEISFLTETQRANTERLFIDDWMHYLKLVKEIARNNLSFLKIYTYSYDIRPLLYDALSHNLFIQEGRLADHVLINGKIRDVLIHSYFVDNINLREARIEDMMIYFEWANDKEVRQNSFNQNSITLAEHKRWFSNKIASSKLILLSCSDDMSCSSASVFGSNALSLINCTFN